MNKKWTVENIKMLDVTSGKYRWKLQWYVPVYLLGFLYLKYKSDAVKSCQEYRQLKHHTLFMRMKNDSATMQKQSSSFLQV